MFNPYARIMYLSIAGFSSSILIIIICFMAFSYCNKHVRTHASEVLEMLVHLSTASGDDSAPLLRAGISPSVGPRGRASNVAAVISCVKNVIHVPSKRVKGDKSDIGSDSATMYAAILVSKQIELDKEFESVYESRLRSLLALPTSRMSALSCILSSLRFSPLFIFSVHN